MKADAFAIKNLSKSHGRRRILDIESASLAAGEITALVGPNGCGKTTLLECLNLLTKPDSGSILFFGDPLSRQVRGRMTLVFQNPCLFDGTVEYNVAFGPRARGRAEPEPINSAIAALRLEPFRGRHVRGLSGGEAKRVSIARALAVAPEALLLDEPTANIDAENTAIIEEAVRALRESHGTTVIIATHSMEQAARLSSRVLLLHEGRLVPYHPDNNFSANLIAENNENILVIGDSLRAAVSTDRPPGRVRCSIPPEDIIVSTTPLQSSARNCWRGAVTAVALENGRVRITVDAGVPVVATITRASYEALRPSIGDALFLTFKASSVKVY